MTVDSVRQSLATPEGFARAVSPKSSLKAGAIGCLIASAVGIAMNLFQLGSASDWDWGLMFQFFFDAEAIEFSGRKSGRSEMMRWVWVWGPVVLLPLGIILLIMHNKTKGQAGAGLYADFQSRGWVAIQSFPGLTVKSGNAQVKIALFSNPSVPEEVFLQAGQGYAAYLASLDKKAMKDVVTQAVKAKVLTGVSASALSPNLPAPILAAPAAGDGDLVIVVPPGPDGKGKLKVLPIKQ